MAREKKINIRLNDDEYAVIPKNMLTHRADVDFCREALTKYTSSKETAAHYMSECEEQDKHIKRLEEELETATIGINNRDKHVKRLADDLVAARESLRVAGDEKKTDIVALEKEIEFLVQDNANLGESLRQATDKANTAIKTNAYQTGRADRAEIEVETLQCFTNRFGDLQSSVDKSISTLSSWKDADDKMLAAERKEKDELTRTNVALEKNLEHAQGRIGILQENSDRLVNQRDAARRKAGGFLGRLFRRILRKRDNNDPNSAGWLRMKR